MLVIFIADRFAVAAASNLDYPWLFVGTTLARSDLSGSGETRSFKEGECEAERRELEAALTPLSVTWLTLEHKAHIVELTKQSGETVCQGKQSGRDETEERTYKIASPVADAAIVSEPGTAVAFTTADCLPIVCASNEHKVAAGIHAGWKSLAEGIIENTVTLLQKKHGVAPSSLAVWIGPAIAQENYEVSQEVRELLMTRLAITERFFVPTRPGHWLVDLPGAASAVFASLGVLPTAIECYPQSTFKSPLLHSARRDGECSGRMATIVAIKKEHSDFVSTSLKNLKRIFTESN